MMKQNDELAAFCIEYLLHKSGRQSSARLDTIIEVIQAYRKSIQRKPVCRYDYKPALRLRRHNAN